MTKAGVALTSKGFCVCRRVLLVWSTPHFLLSQDQEITPNNGHRGTITQETSKKCKHARSMTTPNPITTLSMTLGFGELTRLKKLRRICRMTPGNVALRSSCTPDGQLRYAGSFSMSFIHWKLHEKVREGMGKNDIFKYKQHRRTPG